MAFFDFLKSNKTEVVRGDDKRLLQMNLLAQTIRESIVSGGYDNADTMHQIYEDFGYPNSIGFEGFWNMYRRFGLAKAVVDMLVDLTWVDAPTIKSESKVFVGEFGDLVRNTHLWNRMKGLDRRQRVGRYAGMFIQIKDGKRPDKPVGILNGISAIVKLVPLYEGQLEVQSAELDVMKPNYGEPTLYKFNGSGTGSRDEHKSNSFSIHPSRLLMAAEGADDGSIYGIPALESIYNDLMDVRKITGAGGEGYYQNTRNAPVFTADDDFSDPDDETELADAIDDWLSKHRKRLVLKGIKPQYPNIQLTDPKEFYQNAINNIAAGSGIPSAFLIGQQTGRLASDKDYSHLMTIAQSRRDNFLAILIKSFVDWCILYKVLPMEEYEIKWGDLLTLSDFEKVEVVDKMASANEKQFRSGGQPVFSEEEMRERAGLEFEPEDMPDEQLTAPDIAQPNEEEQKGLKDEKAKVE